MMKSSKSSNNNTASLVVQRPDNVPSSNNNTIIIIDDSNIIFNETEYEELCIYYLKSRMWPKELIDGIRLRPRPKKSRIDCEVGKCWRILRKRIKQLEQEENHIEIYHLLCQLRKFEQKKGPFPISILSSSVDENVQEVVDLTNIPDDDEIIDVDSCDVLDSSLDNSSINVTKRIKIKTEPMDLEKPLLEHLKPKADDDNIKIDSSLESSLSRNMRSTSKASDIIIDKNYQESSKVNNNYKAKNNNACFRKERKRQPHGNITAAQQQSMFTKHPTARVNDANKNNNTNHNSLKIDINDNSYNNINQEEQQHNNYTTTGQQSLSRKRPAKVIFDNNSSRAKLQHHCGTTMAAQQQSSSTKKQPARAINDNNDPNNTFKMEANNDEQSSSMKHPVRDTFNNNHNSLVVEAKSDSLNVTKQQRNSTTTAQQSSSLTKHPVRAVDVKNQGSLDIRAKHDSSTKVKVQLNRITTAQQSLRRTNPARATINNNQHSNKEEVGVEKNDNATAVTQRRRHRQRQQHHTRDENMINFIIAALTMEYNHFGKIKHNNSNVWMKLPDHYKDNLYIRLAAYKGSYISISEIYINQGNNNQFFNELKGQEIINKKWSDLSKNLRDSLEVEVTKIEATKEKNVQQQQQQYTKDKNMREFIITALEVERRGLGIAFREEKIWTNLPNYWKDDYYVRLAAYKGLRITFTEISTNPEKHNEYFTKLKENFIRWSDLPNRIRIDEEFARLGFALFHQILEDKEILIIFHTFPKFANDLDIWMYTITDMKKETFEKYSDNEFRTNSQKMEALINRRPDVALHLQPPLCYDVDFMKKILNNNPCLLEYFDRDIQRALPQLFLDGLKPYFDYHNTSDEKGQGTVLGKHLDPDFWNDSKFVEHWFKCGFGYNPNFQPHEWKNNRIIFLLIAKNTRKGNDASFQHLGEELSQDRVFMRHVLQLNGYLIKYFPRHLRHNDDMAIMAFSFSPGVLEDFMNYVKRKEWMIGGTKNEINIIKCLAKTLQKNLNIYDAFFSALFKDKEVTSNHIHPFTLLNNQAPDTVNALIRHMLEYLGIPSDITEIERCRRAYDNIQKWLDLHNSSSYRRVFPWG